ncbi:MAG: dTDP-4-dehydrorhamnose 3,5-epimerase family protein, partial [Chloroflexi bacterium]|nr:dTDP-4-dehydrorhamnose 3,5-epimerase family protein [Chloroflexota bacterium]
DVLYKVTDYYDPEWERTLIWNDPVIAIEWPLIHGTSPALSKKDSQGKTIESVDLFD